MSNPKPKIYGFFIYTGSRDYPFAGEGWALAEDGELLATHVSSDESTCARSLGMADIAGSEDFADQTSNESIHAEYRAKYPDGYEVEFVYVRDNHSAHAGLQAALAAYRLRYVHEAW